MRGFWLAALLVAGGLAGCLGGDAPDALTTNPPAGTVADYLHNLSEPIEGLSVETGILEQVRIPGPDDVLLDTWIVRPDIEGPVPLVLEVTPYFGGGDPRTAGTTMLFGHAFRQVGTELVSRGYAVGISSVRGTGNSGGCFTQGGPGEAKDTAVVIEHLASQPWSNGNVGLMGVSYPGTTPQDVWIEAPPSLKTIVPIAGISDFYKYNFVNGVPVVVQGFGFNTYYWGMVGLGADSRTIGALDDPASLPGAVVGEACYDQVQVQEGGISSTVDGDKDLYWQVRDFHQELRESWAKNPERASVFYIHGLQDWNVKPHMMETWLPAIQETGVPYKIWLGQWGHAWPQASGGSDGLLTGARDPPPCRSNDACRNDWWDQAMIAWFDQFLKDIDTGILDAPAVQVQGDDMRWRHEESWPPADVAWHDLALGVGGEMGTHGARQANGTAVYHDAQGGAGPKIPVGVPGLSGPYQAVWRSEPLSADWQISGMPRFEANVTASGPRASLMLTLAEERPDGSLRAFNFAAKSLNHVEDPANGRADISGDIQWVKLNFFPQDDVVHEGNRLVLIAAGNLQPGDQPGPTLQPIATGSMIEIDLAGAWLTVPVDHTLEFEEPQPFSS